MPATTGMRRRVLASAPQRAVEYLLAWLMVGWGATLVATDAIMTTSLYGPLLAIMSEEAWGWFAILIGVARILSLAVNGAWRRTPLLRFAGAALGLMGWLVLGALYLVAVRQGATPVPMLGFFPGLIFFECYSCYRCGIDMSAQGSFGSAPSVEARAGAHG